MRKLLFVIHPLPQGDLTKTPGIYLMQAEVVYHLKVVKFCSIRGHWVLIFFFFPKILVNILLGSTMAKRTMKHQRTCTGFRNHKSLITWKVFGVKYHYIFTYFCWFLGISRPVHGILSDQSGLSQSSSVLGWGHLWNPLYRVEFISIFPSASGHFCLNLSW